MAETEQVTAPEALAPEVATFADPGRLARERLQAARGWVFDMDGVLYRGNQALPGVGDLLNALVVRQRRFILATNNSMATPADYVVKLAAMGIDVPVEAILTSGTATRDYLTENLAPGAKVFVIGMPALHQQIFDETGFESVEGEADDVAAVVVGLDLTFTYDKLALATRAIRAGAIFVATNTDATLPTETALVPGAGSIVAALATASGRAPTVVGKPEPLVLDEAMKHLEVTPDQAVMIGDRLDTDIVAGHRAGMLTALVLTGVSTREDLLQAPVLPDLVFTDLRALLETVVGNA